MNYKNLDKSVFEAEKKRVFDLLSGLENKGLKEFSLYLLNSEEMELIKDVKSVLEIEYGYDPHVYKRFNINNIVKVVNDDINIPSYRYNLYFRLAEKRITDPEKVKELLEVEFIRFKQRNKNKLFANLKKAVNEKEKYLLQEKYKQEIEEANKKLIYLQENFNDLDVRISNIKVAKEYCEINFAYYNSVGKKISKSKNLRKNVPNILYYDPVSSKRSDNEFEEFLSKAKNAFGDIYFSEKI